MQPEATIAFVVAYLIGSIDFGSILPRLGGVDIYSVGSGNPGASNVLRTMGRGWAVAVLVGDVGKGTVGVMIADLWAGEVAAFAAILAVAAGHSYPVWHRFKGGKGVAVTAGALLWVEPLLGVLLMALWAGLMTATSVASIASLVIMALLVPGLAVFGHRGWSLAWAAATAVLIVSRHKGNIGRMIRGEERKVQAS